MADQKASVVLGAAFVTATIVFGDVASEDSLDPMRLALLLTAIGSGILAAIALAPKVRLKRGEPHLLFFGSIAMSPAAEYRRLMNDMLADDKKIYDAIITDSHTASGAILRSKFRPLRASYGVLVVGMIATFVVALAT